MIGPLTLSLESSCYRIVAQGFFAETCLGKPRISNHQVTGNQGHFDYHLPLPGFAFSRKLLVRIIQVGTFLTIFLYPGKRSFIFCMIIDATLGATDDFGHIDHFGTHSQIVKEKFLIHIGTAIPIDIPPMERYDLFRI